jgi:hypothetical protein
MVLPRAYQIRAHVPWLAFNIENLTPRRRSSTCADRSGEADVND